MYRNIHKIPKEILESLYVEERWSVRDVADYFGCSVDTIVRRMKAYGIARRTAKKEIHRASLVDLYESGTRTLSDLADTFNVSPTTITNRLHEYGVLCSPSVTCKPIDPERIKKAYESGNSTTYIAEITGLTRWKVLHILRHMGVTIRGHRRQVQPIEAMVYLYTYHRMSTKDIGIAFGLQANTVALYLRESGIAMRGKTLTLDVDEIRRLYAEGMSVSKIAQAMSCSASAVRSRLKREGMSKE